MALPSGTTISADDINSKLGRTAGTAVDWNTTVRVLGSDNSTPNLNNIRGVVTRGMSYSSGQSSDNYQYFTSECINAFALNNSPWRIVVRQLPNMVSGNTSPGCGIEITAFSTGQAGIKRYSTSGDTLPFLLPNRYNTGNPTPVVAYADQPRVTLLDNNKLVLVSAIDNVPGFARFGSFSDDRGILISILQLDTTGSITSERHYVTKLGKGSGTDTNNSYYTRPMATGNNGTATGGGQNNFLSSNNSLMSHYGNKFVFDCYAIGPVDYNWWSWIVLVDASGTDPVIRYTLVDNIQRTYTTSYPPQNGMNPTLLADGTIAVAGNGGVTSSATLQDQASIQLNILNTSGNGWTTTGVAASEPVGRGTTTANTTQATHVSQWAYEYAGGVSTNNSYKKQWNWIPGYGSFTNSTGGTGSAPEVFIEDNPYHGIKNYYVARTYFAYQDSWIFQYSQNFGGSPTWGCGTFAAMLIQKVNSANGNIKNTVCISSENPLSSSYVSSKNFTGYTYGVWYPFSGRAIKSIVTDSSDNTYVLVKVLTLGRGATTTTSPGGPTQYASYNASVPNGCRQYYVLIKYSNAGVALWKKTLDLIGSSNKNMDTDPTSYASSSFYNRAQFTILLREEIGLVEVYATYGVDTNANAYLYIDGGNNTPIKTRTASFDMSSGQAGSPSIAAATSPGWNSLSTKSITSGYSESYYNSGNTLTTVTVDPISFTNRAVSSNSVTAVPPLSTVASATLSVVSTTSRFTVNPTLITTGGTYTYTADNS